MEGIVMVVAERKADQIRYTLNQRGPNQQSLIRNYKRTKVIFQDQIARRAISDHRSQKKQVASLDQAKEIVVLGRQEDQVHGEENNGFFN
jgi:type II secretory pathway component PulC